MLLNYCLRLGFGLAKHNTMIRIEHSTHFSLNLIVYFLIGCMPFLGLQSKASTVKSCASLFETSNTNNSNYEVLTEIDPSLRFLIEDARLIPRVIKPNRLSDLGFRFRFSHLATLAFHILEKYPLDKYYFVGIGRSPFPIIDMIRQISPESASTLPISYNTYVRSKIAHGISRWWSPMNVSPRKLELEPFSQGTDQQRDALFEEMDQFIPSEQELAGRQIVVLDFSSSGRSLSKFSVDLSAYLKNTDRNLEHALIFISSEDHRGEWVPYQLSLAHLGKNNFKKIVNNTEWYRLADNPKIYNHLKSHLPSFSQFLLRGDFSELSYVLDREEYKPYAPYVHYSPSPNQQNIPATLTERTAHKKFVEVLGIQFLEQYKINPKFKSKIDEFRTGSK